MGAVLGFVAVWRGPCRLGPAATGNPGLSGFPLGFLRGYDVWHRRTVVQLCGNPPLWQSGQPLLPACQPEPPVHPTDRQYHQHPRSRPPGHQWRAQIQRSERQHRPAAAILSPGHGPPRQTRSRRARHAAADPRRPVTGGRAQHERGLERGLETEQGEKPLGSRNGGPSGSTSPGNHRPFPRKP